jgi:hypothetical protein
VESQQYSTNPQGGTFFLRADVKMVISNHETTGDLVRGSRPSDIRGYVQDTARLAGVSAAQLRADRLLAEVEANGGDVLRLTHLFGISDPTAIRYCAEVGPLDSSTRRTPAGTNR